MYAALTAEERNVPSATLVNKGFFNDAMSAASSRGVPNARIVATSVPCEGSVIEEIESGIDAAMDEILSVLTKPLTREEESPSVKEKEQPARIIFKGDLQDINMFYYRRGWGDGLPIIPPTEEAVAEMLTGTDLPADHIVGKLMPRFGWATVEKIAVNAVMAGALPTYLPLLIAGVQAFLEPRSGYDWISSSGASPGACWVVNGPVRNDLNFNNSYGVLSPGHMANSVFGRTMGLIMKNIGGARKGVEEMGCMGNPAKYTMVVAENEEESPWEPLHVQLGYDKNDSTITEWTYPGGNYHQFGSGTRGHDDTLTPAQKVLSTILENIKGRSCLMLTPSNAKILSKAGYTKKDVKAFLCENAMEPFVPGPVMFLNQSRVNLKQTFIPGQPVRVILDPDEMMIVVTGGDGPIKGGLAGSPPGIYGGTGLMTKKIELPAKWDSLVKKYKDVVPVYARQ